MLTNTLHFSNTYMHISKHILLHFAVFIFFICLKINIKVNRSTEPHVLEQFIPQVLQLSEEVGLRVRENILH